jgi:ubiquinone/menaquinone biosynthesis C-methylase UbiE
MNATLSIFGRTSERRLEPEAMDDPTLDAHEHARALKGLARLNRLSGATRQITTPLASLCQRLDRPVRVLDVATGSGDIPIALMRRAERLGLALQVDGCDVSPVAVASANERMQSFGGGATDATFFVHDVVRDPLPTGYDAVICSLFLHHLSRREAVGLLGEMRRAAQHLLVVNDLERRPIHEALVFAGSRLVTRSWVVRKDAVLSIRAAFTRGELRAMANEAGLKNIELRGGGQCRMQLVWQRGSDE